VTEKRGLAKKSLKRKKGKKKMGTGAKKKKKLRRGRGNFHEEKTQPEKGGSV